MDAIDTGELSKRIEARILALDINPRKLDKMAGVASGFTYDLLAGRKSQPRIANLERIALALECSLDFLLYGRNVPVSPVQDLPLVGYCEDDAWRSKPVVLAKSGCAPDPRFPADLQQAFEVRDGHAAVHGVSSGETVVTLTANGMAIVGITPGYGDLVVVTRREGDRFETRLLSLEGPESILGRTDIEGLVLASVRRFRGNHAPHE
jgi:hypothetical protein